MWEQCTGLSPVALAGAGLAVVCTSWERRSSVDPESDGRAIAITGEGAEAQGDSGGMNTHPYELPCPMRVGRTNAWTGGT